ncbi:MAG: MFS transporter [Desulfobacteraceae bacterium]|nr:MFS transporter [Desulfobacteraceae bacterium]
MANHPPDAPAPLRLAWLVWGLGAMFYLMALFHRVAPAVMTVELMREFHISAGALGNLAAFYFYSYAAMQTPTGIWADVWGPRRLLSTGALVAALGTFLFALAPSFFWAGTGRLLIGASVAVAFVGLLKLSTCWFPPRYFAMVSGMAVLVGIAGAVFAGTPLRLLMDLFGWRQVMLIVAVVTLVIGLAIWIFVRDFPPAHGDGDANLGQTVKAGTSARAIVAGIREVFRYRNTALLMVIPGCLPGSTLTFTGLWGVPYLTTHYGLTPSKAAVLTSSMMVATALGSPTAGWLSDRLGRRKPVFMIGCALALVHYAAAFYWPNLPFSIMVLCLLMAGFSASTVIITFAMAKESVPERFAGTISGVANTGVMIGPMLLQPAVSWMLDHRWQGQMREGVRIYSQRAYQSGFAIMLTWMALSLVLLFFTQETYCRQRK